MPDSGKHANPYTEIKALFIFKSNIRFQLKNKRRREIELGGIPTTPVIEGAEFEQYDIHGD